MTEAVLQLHGFKLTVKGYEFPHLSDGSYDANWLVADAALHTDSGRLNFTHKPCLLTWELHDLAVQLDMLSRPPLHRRWRIDFEPMESYVRLHFSGDGEHILFEAKVELNGPENPQTFEVEWRTTQEVLDDFRQQLKRVNEVFPQKEQK